MPCRALLHTPEQAAALLNVPESWLRRAVADGRAGATFLGKHLRFSDDDLCELIANHRRPPKAT